MNNGDLVTVNYKGQSRKMIVLSHEERLINGYSYTVYNLGEIKDVQDGGENEIHRLYVNKNAPARDQLDMEGHLIGSEMEIQGGDYYMIKDKETQKEDKNGRNYQKI